MFPRLYCLSLNGGGCLEGWLEDALDKWERVSCEVSGNDRIQIS